MHAFVLVLVFLNTSNAQVESIPSQGFVLLRHGLAYATKDGCNTAGPMVTAANEKLHPGLTVKGACVDVTSAEVKSAPEKAPADEIVWHGTVPSLIPVVEYADETPNPTAPPARAVLYEYTYNTITKAFTHAQAVEGYPDAKSCHSSMSKWAMLGMGSLKPNEVETFFCVYKGADGTSKVAQSP